MIQSTDNLLDSSAEYTGPPHANSNVIQLSDWIDRSRPDPAHDRKNDVIGIIREPGFHAFDGPDQRLFAYDRSLMTEAENEEILAENWEHLCTELQEVFQPDISIIKFGTSLVDDLGFDWQPLMAPFHLQLREPDEHITRAFVAALLAAVNSAPKKTDWDTVVLALATFVHALPAYQELANVGEEFSKPFGTNTGWRLAKFGPAQEA